MFNQYPYLNIEDLNLDYLMARMRNLEQIVKNFVALESVTFADPIQWNITRQYAKNVVVLDENGNAFISKETVPVGVYLNNGEYWLEIFNFMDYVKSFNSNLTFNIEDNTDRASIPYNVGDWLLLDDVLYKVIVAIPADGLFEIGANIEHFTVEDFIKAWINYANGLIVQYKNDIDASELQFTNNLTQLFNQAVAGVTVDSEVLLARVGWDGTTYPTLADAIQTQVRDIHETAALIQTTTETDLDNIDLGIFNLSYSGTYTNCPIATNNRRVLIALDFTTQKAQFVYNPTNGVLYSRMFADNAWGNWTRVNNDMITVLTNIVNSGFAARTTVETDLDNVTTSGFYSLAYATTYTNCPIAANTRRVLFVYVHGYTQITQMIYDPTTGVSYIRFWQSGTWGAWKRINDDAITTLTNLVNSEFFNRSNASTDLNDYMTSGYYTLGYSTVFSNCPIAENSRRLVLVYKYSAGLIGQIAINMLTGEFYTRYYAGSWSIWHYMAEWTFNAINRELGQYATNKILTSDFIAQSPAAGSDGDRITCMSYNVANYNKDTALYISAEQVINYRHLLEIVNADILATQEDQPHIDSASALNSNTYIYYPKYVYNEGNQYCAIRSKKQLFNSQSAAYSTGRQIRWATQTINGKDLLIVNTHLTAGTDAADISARATEIDELFDWLAGNITLGGYSVPTHTHVVILGDFNVTTDRDTLTLYANTNNFVCANGGLLDWMITTPDLNGCPDNIIVSDNIIIDKTTIYNGYYLLLRSDHVPIACDLILL